MSINRSMDKEVVVHIHNGILLGHKIEHLWISADEVDEPRTYYTEWSKSEVKVKSLSSVQFFETPWTVAYQAPPSMGFSRQEYWSGLPFSSPMHESEKWKWSCSVVSDSSRPYGLQPTRLVHPGDFPGKSTGVGCHHFLHFLHCCPVNKFFITIFLDSIYIH